MTKLLGTPAKFFLGLGDGLQKPHYPNNKNELLICWDNPEDLVKILTKVEASSGVRFSLKFTGQHQMIFCVFLWSVCLHESHTFEYGW